MILMKNVESYLFLSKKSNDLPYTHVCMTEYPYLNAAVYSFPHKEEEQRLGFLSGIEEKYCRRYMAKAKGMNIYIELKGVVDGSFNTKDINDLDLHKILQDMADFASNAILKDSPKSLSFSTRFEDWQPLEEWCDAKSSFKPIF